MVYNLLNSQGRPKAPPATQNTSQKSLGEIRKLWETKFTFLLNLLTN